MRAPSTEELLGVWEAGFAQPPLERALALLAVACPEASWDQLAKLSIGQRDVKLLKLRETLWGPQMTAVVACPKCQERMELSLDTREMSGGSQPSQPAEISLRVSGFDMTFRLPTSLDLMAAEGKGTTEGATALLHRCLLSVEQGAAEQRGARIDFDKLPPEAVEGLTKSMAEADPLADIQLSLSCPNCEQPWRGIFDIVSFLWTELEVWAWRILKDVHTLAQAYGWSEREILRLSPTRRQFYLDMVGA